MIEQAQVDGRTLHTSLGGGKSYAMNTLRIPRWAILFLLNFVCVIPALGQDSMRGSAASTQPATTAEADGSGTGTETIVFLRHGEKPPHGLGQLTPQGLNRAIALSTLLPAKYGKPDY